MSEATVQTGQVESGVSEAAAVAVIAITLALVSRQDESVKVVQEAVSGEEDVLDPQAVQVVQVVLGRKHQRVKERGVPSPLTSRATTHGLCEVGVKLQHVVELLLKFCWLQSFVLIVL